MTRLGDGGPASPGGLLRIDLYGPRHPVAGDRVSHAFVAARDLVLCLSVGPAGCLVAASSSDVGWARAARLVAA